MNVLKIRCCVMATDEGAVSGRWEVIASLGEGGYAEVYEVRDTLSPEATRVRLADVANLYPCHAPAFSAAASLRIPLTASSVAMQYALKIDTPKVKKDPRLATVRNEAEVCHSLTMHMPTPLLALTTRDIPSTVLSPVSSTMLSFDT